MTKVKRTDRSDGRIFSIYLSDIETVKQIRDLSKKTGVPLGWLIGECVKASIDKVERTLMNLPSFSREDD